MFRVFFLNARLIFFFFFFWKTHANTFEFTLPIPLYIYIKYTVFRSVALHSRISANASILETRNQSTHCYKTVSQITSLWNIYFSTLDQKHFTLYVRLSFIDIGCRRGKATCIDTIKKIKNYPSRNLSISLYSFFDDIHLKYTSSSQVELKLFPISSSSNFIVSFRLLKRVVLKQTRFY